VVQLDAFQTIADPTRRRIVEVLRGGERQVNDVVGRLDIHQSGVSRHLRILLDAGFVQMRPDGQRRLYSLRPKPFRDLDAWVAGYRGLWEARLDRFGSAVKKKQAARARSRSVRAASQKEKKR
jgi:DNA-binding transcriptional ArsR family regulator